jgi:hypothetical protein
MHAEVLDAEQPELPVPVEDLLYWANNGEFTQVRVCVCVCGQQPRAGRACALRAAAVLPTFAGVSGSLRTLLTRFVRGCALPVPPENTNSA